RSSRWWTPPGACTGPPVRNAPRGGMARDLPQRVSVAAQWVVIAAGIAAFVVAAPPGRHVPRTVCGWILTILAALGLGVVALLADISGRLAGLAVIPPIEIANATAGRIPPARGELAERGRYLFTVASCALCHGAMVQRVRN